MTDDRCVAYYTVILTRVRCTDIVTGWRNVVSIWVVTALASVLGLGGSWARQTRNTWVLGGFGLVISSVQVYVGPMGRVK
jgi:hypothetical protein